MVLPERVRDARERTGLSQRQLAKRLGIQPSALCHIEAGRRDFSVESFRQFCLATEASADWLLGLPWGEAS